MQVIAPLLQVLARMHWENIIHRQGRYVFLSQKGRIAMFHTALPALL